MARAYGGHKNVASHRIRNSKVTHAVGAITCHAARRSPPVSSPVYVGSVPN
jgi:hypothetical protein